MPDQKILYEVSQRLKRFPSGATARDIARSTRILESEVNNALLELQRTGLAVYKTPRWKWVGGGPELPGERPIPVPKPDPTPPTLPVDKPTKPQEPANRRHLESRWKGFRALCEYYAECVRLDQKSTVHAKADDEGLSMVCLRGGLPQTNAFDLQIPADWHEWAKESTRHQYLFLGYPLHRYLWKDSTSDAKATYCSPVFMVPCSFKISQMRLSIEPLGQIRLNEGWLERRLRNLEERRAFFELCGWSEDNSSFVQADSFRDWQGIARLIQHYYPEWCVESLNPNALKGDPKLASLSKDGIHNRAVLVFPKSFRFTKRLHEELMEIAHKVPDSSIESSAIGSVFRPDSQAPRPDSNSPNAADLVPSMRSLLQVEIPKLNSEQRAACNAAATAPLSILVGPPGTGKSRVVQAVLCMQAIRGSNALFASKNHQALEAVVPRVNALTDPLAVIIRLARPWGEPVDLSFANALAKLVAIGRTDFEDDLDELAQELETNLQESSNTRELLFQLSDARAELLSAIEQASKLRAKITDPNLAEFLDGLDATKVPSLPTCSQIKKVLNRLDSLTANDNSWWRRLLGYFRKLPLKSSVRQAAEIDAVFRRWLDPRGAWPVPPMGNPRLAGVFFREALAFLMPLRECVEALEQTWDCRVKLNALPQSDELLQKDEKLSSELEQISHQLIKSRSRRIGAGLTNEERTRLAEVLSAIRNQSALDDDVDSRRLSEALRRTFPTFLKHFPLAATTNLSVGRDLPLQPGLFDLLVVDEASQCDIASVIPLLFRCRRALIVGDPMQLQHVTSISAATDRQLRSQFGVGAFEFERFSYRTVSMFDLAAASDSTKVRTVLRQHHRCHPEIAEYCNDSFYHGDWTVLTESNGKRGLYWTDVPDDCKPVAGGGVISTPLIDSVCDELKRLQSQQFSGTIGIVTPFRQQADRTRDRVHADFDVNLLKAWQLLVDTADGFQGDERDLVLFCLPGGDGMAEGSMQFLANGPNRFNVAVSRAKRVLHVFGDRTWASSCGIRHIEILLRKCDESEQNDAVTGREGFRTDLIGPVWEPFLASKLQEAGIPFIQQYPSCGRFLDFAVFQNGKKINIEVDGETWHKTASGLRCRADLDRDRTLVAAGWTVLRFWVYELKERPSECIARIRQAIT